MKNQLLCGLLLVLSLATSRNSSGFEYDPKLENKCKAGKIESCKILIVAAYTVEDKESYKKYLQIACIHGSKSHCDMIKEDQERERISENVERESAQRRSQQNLEEQRREIASDQKFNEDIARAGRMIGEGMSGTGQYAPTKKRSTTCTPSPFGNGSVTCTED